MIYRIDVRTAGTGHGGRGGVDSLGEAIRHQIQEFGIEVGPISTSRIFLIDTEASLQDVQRIAEELLADPVVEEAVVMGAKKASDPISRSAEKASDPFFSRIEIHLKPGVMDPVAASTEMAIRDMGLSVREVRTGRAYVIQGKVPREQLQTIASRVLANGVIESVHFDAYVPERFERGREYRFQLKRVGLRELSDAQLQKLSREGHLFLSLAEMKAIQNYFRQQDREPTDIELEALAQTWSEHCVHKTLKSGVEVYDEAGKLLRKYGNLIKETIFASTKQLMDGDQANDFCLSVFKDNAGVIAFDETDGVCFKVETHNHPSAIEPYGGSATGIGGVIRDVLGTGLAAKPIANTDVFCVAFPDGGRWAVGGGQCPHPSPVPGYRERGKEGGHAGPPLPKGVIHPKHILQQVVAGVRDYGNRMGIPTVNGAVYFDNRYLGNPLVFCGCVGLIPRDKIEKEAQAGDAIVVMGGRTGRDGIHGATFSSAELTDTHADEFSHAVQIGNAITEKKVTDVLLAARDRGLFTDVTDCGAGGLSSSVGELGAKIGAEVHLDRVPLKYAGLRYDEIWISEAQERMVLSVPQEKVKEVLELARSEDVEATVIGRFGTPDRALVLHYNDTEVGRISMDFLHNGIPMPMRKAVVGNKDEGRRMKDEEKAAASSFIPHPPSLSLKDRLLSLLAHPNIASKHWIIRQYDHEVQGGSVIKPLTGPRQVGPSDAAVIRPKLDSYRGVALGCGMAPQIEDPYQMALASIDEAIRNVVAVGADPDKIAILDNFCWPSVDDERTMGTLVRACEACRDTALAYGIPFISGKDSLHNQFTNQETGEVIRIPNTLLISAIGVIEDVRKCVTMDLRKRGNPLYVVRASLDGQPTLEQLSVLHRRLAEMIAAGRVVSCHDISDGGLLVAVAEMCIASGLGAVIDIQSLAHRHGVDLFNECPGQYIVEISRDRAATDTPPPSPGPRVDYIGRVDDGDSLRVTHPQQGKDEVAIDELTRAWRGTLDW